MNARKPEGAAFIFPGALSRYAVRQSGAAPWGSPCGYAAVKAHTKPVGGFPGLSRLIHMPESTVTRLVGDLCVSAVLTGSRYPSLPALERRVHTLDAFHMDD